ncbi:MAG: hypothetical protein HQK53_11335 [Oligoflexia bacterium]|nr:hypothetical protein [Oligoflexia bacterium]
MFCYFRSHLLRDRFGEKTLFYRRIEQNFYFCSEIDPLLRIDNKCELKKIHSW